MSHYRLSCDVLVARLNHGDNRAEVPVASNRRGSTSPWPVARGRGARAHCCYKMMNGELGIVAGKVERKSHSMGTVSCYRAC